MPARGITLFLRLLPPALIAVLAATLAYLGAPPGVIAMICALFVVPYAYTILKAAAHARQELAQPRAADAALPPPERAKRWEKIG